MTKATSTAVTLTGPGGEGKTRKRLFTMGNLGLCGVEDLVSPRRICKLGRKAVGDAVTAQVDRHVMAKLAAGDRQAVTRLIYRHAPGLRRFHAGVLSAFRWP